MSGNAVETHELVRDYAVPGRKSLRALGGLNFDVRAGEIHGLLGPNGAGKTTLVRVLSTALLPTSGSATVLGFDVVKDAAKIRQRVALVLGGERGLFANLSVLENLLYWAALFGVGSKLARSRAQQLLCEVNLTDRADDRIGTLSRGMKQRVHLARGLMSQPDLVFLDEPSAGMDPIGAQSFQGTLKRLKDCGHTVLITTHDMSEAAAVCDRVSFLDRGAVLASVAPDEVGALVDRGARVEFSATVEITQRLRQSEGAGAVDDLGEGRFAIYLCDGRAIPRIIERIVAAGATRLSVKEPTLHDAYVQLISKREVEGPAALPADASTRVSARRSTEVGTG